MGWPVEEKPQGSLFVWVPPDAVHPLHVSYRAFPLLGPRSLCFTEHMPALALGDKGAAFALLSNGDRHSRFDAPQDKWYFQPNHEASLVLVFGV